MSKLNPRAAIANANMTQREVAEKMGVSTHTMSSWVTGKTKMSKRSLLAFCSVTGTEPDNIILPCDYILNEVEN